jgi:hypothetical protein
MVMSNKNMMMLSNLFLFHDFIDHFIGDDGLSLN